MSQVMYACNVLKSILHRGKALKLEVMVYIILKYGKTLKGRVKMYIILKKHSVGKRRGI